MQQIKPLSDHRLENMCSYCGEKAETKDHVPSRVLLDEPLPENLPIVPCCLKCNNDFSLDEEYFACAIECAQRGTTEINKLKREKVITILSRKKALQQEIENSFIVQNGERMLQVERDRFLNVIIKLAKGHAKFENSEPRIENPYKIWMNSIVFMSESDIDTFLTPMPYNILPEVGSRALHNILFQNDRRVFPNWIIVQDRIYQYLVTPNIGLYFVRILICDYLALEIKWQEREKPDKKPFYLPLYLPQRNRPL